MRWLSVLLLLLLVGGCGGGGVPIGATSANAYLNNVTLSNGVLNREFRRNVDTYTAAVANDVTSIKISPETADLHAVAYVNDIEVGSGRYSGEIPLQVGENVIRVKVIAPDEVTSRNYHFTIIREPGRNANLDSLMLSGGSLNEYFLPNIFSYTARVPFETEGVALIPSVEQITASVTVNGILVASGSASQVVPLFVGSNIIGVTVTAQDGRKQQTYTVTVTRADPVAVSNDGTLKNLLLSSGAMDQSFVSNGYSYTQTVGPDVTHAMVTPVANTDGAQIQVNGVITASGSPSSPITLVAGAETVIAILVTAQDGKTSQSYSIRIYRQARTDALLANLLVSQGSLSPVFSADVYAYSMTLANAIASLTITPTALDSQASVVVNGTTLSATQPSRTISLVTGTNQVDVVVTAQDGRSQKNYSIMVIRQGGANVNLLSLVPSAGALNPVFASTTLSYSIDVVNATSSLTLTPTAVDGTAVIRVNGGVVPSGNASGSISLNVGANDIPVTVTSADGQTSQAYVVRVNRAGVTADLNSLVPSLGSLTPAFSRGTSSYTLSVGNTTSQISFTPTVVDPASTLTVANVAVVSGVVSSPVALAVGNNAIDVVVTASDASTRTYTVTVVRAGAENADLSGLAVSSGSLSPVFDSAKTAYLLEVLSSATSLNVTPTLSDSSATVKVGNVSTFSGIGVSVSLVVGNNSIPVRVTAQDNVTTKLYTLDVHRPSASNKDLISLQPSQGVLSPTFSSAVLAYNLTLPNSATTLALTPTADAVGASIKVNGVSVASGATSGAISLNVGSNIISVVVTPEDGSTPRTYTVTAERAASNDATLSGLSLSQGGMTPSFASGVTAYSLNVANSVSSVTITPTATFAQASIQVNGAVVASGNSSGPIALNTGNNSISIRVAAQDGVTTKNYSVVVYRAASSNPNLATLSLSSGSLTPVFDGAVTDYAVEVNNAVSSIYAVATGVSTLGQLQVNGISVVPGNPSQTMALVVGDNTLLVDTVSQDGSASKRYTVTIKRLPASQINADLVDLRLSVGHLDQVFQTAQRNYSANFGYLQPDVKVIATAAQQATTIKVNGVSVASGQASQAISLLEGGDTLISIDVTGSDGVTSQTYAINVARAALASFAQQAYIKASNTGAGDNFGYSVALSGDTLAVGAWQEDGNASADGYPGSADNNLAADAGAVYIFVRDAAGAWSQQAYLKPASLDAGDQFGSDVALQGDVLVVGSPREDSSSTGVNGAETNYDAGYDSGAVFVFERSSGVWSKTAYLKPAVNALNPSFGWSVDISGDVIVVGTPWDDGSDSGVQNSATGGYTNLSSTNAGSATVFVRSGGSWGQQAYLKADNPGGSAQFGYDVAVDGETIVVGAPYEDSGFNDSGAAYVFVRNSGLWAQQARLKAVTAINADLRTGLAVDISGDTVVAGATKQDSSTTDSGAVYVFVRNSGAWSEQTLLKTSIAGPSDQLGLSVHLDGNNLLVGALGEDGGNTGVNGDASNNGVTDAGAGYVFVRSNGVWTQRFYLKPHNNSVSDQFCRINALDGDTVVCASYLEDGSSMGVNNASNDSATDAGAVYVFR
ncbi:MAG: cadherin-like beta sandwich domain-containing protein [Gammaproteobacteria bacterium]|nr:cadherin-like beta sandwich domain-containing protein [Gammaproteobacteria bacterium]